MIRRARLLVLGAVAAVLLTGCGVEPGRAGAAAIVGGTRIPVAEVQSWMREAFAQDPDLEQRLQQQGRLDDSAREIAGHLVKQELVEQVAQREGLRVSPGRVEEVIDRHGGVEEITRGSLLTPQQARSMARSALLLTELGRKYVPRLAVTVDYVQAADRREAGEKARRMAMGPQEADRLLQEERRGDGQVVVDQRMTAAEDPEVAAMTPLFGALPGTVVAFEPRPRSGQWVVARVKQRSADEQVVRDAAPLDDQVLEAVGTRLLAVTADRVGVQLSPRYGVWDPIALTAVPNEEETRGFWFSPVRAEVG